MKLHELGEFGLIDRISSHCIVRQEGVLKGIGDDCAVIDLSQEEALLVTTDVLVERVHFCLPQISPWQLGYKSLAVNLSDIAAMGGKARDAFISLGIPGEISVEFLEEFYSGMKTLASKYAVNILGGDTTLSKSDLFISITVTGTIKKARICYRSGATVGDAICVTGTLGDSAAGLEIITSREETTSKLSECLVNAHLEPFPQIEEGQFLAESGVVTAMIDVSDGLSSDIRHICQQSNVGAILYESRIPLSESLKHYAARYNKDPLHFALAGGEDYCLLFTVNNGFFEGLARTYHKKFNAPLFCIGEIVSGPEIILVKKNKEKIRMPSTGYDHFKSLNL